MIRPLREGDSFAELTLLLHRAYAPLAEAGLRFFATHQTEADTRDRALAGECFVFEQGGAIVGTVTLREGEPGPAAFYGEPGVFVFGQLAVDPLHKGRGIGRQLLDHVEARARERGARFIACDTAEPAGDLIALYERRGYRRVGYAKWSVTNYRSVILAKPLSGAG